MKLLLADDHTLFRDALVQYIQRAQSDASITIAKDFHEALACMKVNPDHDLVLLDLRMPGMNGMEGFRTMRESFPSTPLALMSGVAEVQDVEAAFELGAMGYFPKTLSGKALLQAIELVLSGEKFKPLNNAASAVMPSYHSDEKPKKSSYGTAVDLQDPVIKEGIASLTPREKDVLRHLVQGAPNKEIANALGLQIVTVKLHVRGLCRKLNAKNRTQVALIGKEYGFDQ